MATTINSADNLRHIEAKLNEFDEIAQQLSNASRLLHPLFARHQDTIKRLNNRSRAGKDTGRQLQELRTLAAEFPSALSALSEIASSLSSLARDIERIIPPL